MKNHGIYALVCIALLVTLLTGCANTARDYDNGVNGNGTYSPDPNSGIVTDTDGMIDDVNNRNDIVDRPVTDGTKTDRNIANGLDRAGNAVKNGVNRVGNAIENGVNDLTGNQPATTR